MFEILFVVVVKVVSGSIVDREGLDQLELDNDFDTGRKLIDNIYYTTNISKKTHIYFSPSY